MSVGNTRGNASAGSTSVSTGPHGLERASLRGPSLSLWHAVCMVALGRAARGGPPSQTCVTVALFHLDDPKGHMAPTPLDSVLSGSPPSETGMREKRKGEG